MFVPRDGSDRLKTEEEVKGARKGSKVQKTGRRRSPAWPLRSRYSGNTRSEDSSSRQLCTRPLEVTWKS
jgi:hypothetical protein